MAKTKNYLHIRKPRSENKNLNNRSEMRAEFQHFQSFAENSLLAVGIPTDYLFLTINVTPSNILLTIAQWLHRAPNG